MPEVDPGFGAVHAIGYCSQRTAGRAERPATQCDADVAQLVERNLAKVEVASSSLVVRSEWSDPLPDQASV